MRVGSKRGLGALIAALALTTSLAACGGGSGGGGESQNAGGNGGGGDTAETSGESGGGEEGGSSGNLVVGTTDSVATVDPAKCYSYFCGNILQNAAQTLIDYKPGTTSYQPMLAAKLPKISKDGLTYTFKLRKGVTFQDGSKMTAKDVKFSLNRARWINHPEGAGFLLNGIKRIDTPSKYKVVIHLKAPDITFSSKLAYTVATIVPSDAYKSPDGPRPDNVKAEKFINSKLIGTGPYKVVDFREGQSITLQSWDGYWGKKPAADKVLVKFYGKSSQLLAALKAGEIDIAFRALTPVQRNELQKNTSDDLKVVAGPGAAIHYIVFNTRLKPTNDPKVRKAVASAIDRDRLIESALGGDAKPLYSMIPPFFDANVPTFKNKYADKEPSDFLGDKKVDVELWYGTNHYGPTEPLIAQSLKRMLEETGSFNVTTHSAPWAQFTSSAYPGKSGQYQMFQLGWYPDYLDPDDYIAPFYACDSFLQYYCNDTMEKLIKKERAAKAPDSKARMQTFAKMQNLAAKDVPLIPLVVLQPFAFAHKDVHGLKDTMGPEQIFRYYMLSKG